MPRYQQPISVEIQKPAHPDDFQRKNALACRAHSRLAQDVK
jgi:hypothetical protein